MAIQISCDNPAAVLAKLTKSAQPKGEAETWGLDAKGRFHHVGQWKDAGTFSGVAQKNSIMFLFARGTEVKQNAYEYLHGRFIEMIMKQALADINFIKIADLRPSKKKS